MTNPQEPQTPLVLPQYWRSLDERAETPEAQKAAHNEFSDGVTDPPPPGGFSRRDFMGLVGAAATLATATACSRRERGPVVAYTRRPQEVVPGVANHYASTFSEGRRAYSVLVKTREGRPIHITGNDEHPIFKGKTSPRALADLLRLYEADRLRGPRIEGRDASWKDADARLIDALKGAKAAGKPVLLLTGATTSPSTRAALADLKAALPTLEHLAWESSEGHAQAAAMATFGSPVLPTASLEKAKVILSLGADFLNGDEPQAIAAFAAGRRLNSPHEAMSRLYVVEGPMTLTGTNADHRFPVKPSRIAAVAFALAGALAAKGLPLPAGLSGLPSGVPEGIDAKSWKHLVEDLAHARSGAAVLCGDDLPAEAHQAAHLLNAMLGSAHVAYHPAQPLASLKDLEAAVGRMASGTYAAVLVWGANPAYALPKGKDFADAFTKVPLRAWIGLSPDETAAGCTLLLPEHHWLEAWNDHASPEGVLSLQQPAIGALYDTRQGEDTLLALLHGLGASVPATWLDYLKARWRREVYPAGSLTSFDRFFEVALHDGVLKGRTQAPASVAPKGAALAQAAQTAASARTSDFELLLRPDVSVLDGRHANNGWLQELPDPITKVTWGNPVSVAASDAQALGLQDGDQALVTVGSANLVLPVVIQPGQAKGTLVLALGYGRATGAVAKGIGTNAFPLLDSSLPAFNLRGGVKLTKGRGRKDLAQTQSHHRMEGRDIVRSWTVAEFAHHVEHPHKPHELHSLNAKEIEYKGQKWGMAIDLSACVGCSGCVVACGSENNVPVVGPKQVSRGREMHWIRIDRYYEGEIDNPKVVHQPMLCQHCDDAPCENVCPVNATNHSPDGLNQMAYNRCVGTRYCANNCPYKVRRFNFLEFTADKVEPESLVYNPEVTVRPRGVMEKCTFCVQRIQDGRQRAAGENRPLTDADVMPACAVACPSDAIIFGDLNNPDSRVSRFVKSQRGYKVLEELGVRPAITYLADLKNPAGEGGHHEA